MRYILASLLLCATAALGQVELQDTLLTRSTIAGGTASNLLISSGTWGQSPFVLGNLSLGSSGEVATGTGGVISFGTVGSVVGRISVGTGGLVLAGGTAGIVTVGSAGSIFIPNNGSVSQPSIVFSGRGTNYGFYSANPSRLNVTVAGVDVATFWSDGAFYAGSNGEIRSPSTAGSFSINGDVILRRSAAAVWQVGTNHATTATNQMVKSMDVTTGTGGALTISGGNAATGTGGAGILRGGTGSVVNGPVYIQTGTVVRIRIDPDGQIYFPGLQTSAGSTGAIYSNGGVLTLSP